MMPPMRYRLVEWTGDLANSANVYILNVIESDLPVEVTLDHLVETKDRVSWEPSILMNQYTVECSMDGFVSSTRYRPTPGTAVCLFARLGKSAIPVVFVFDKVGPVSFHKEFRGGRHHRLKAHFYLKSTVSDWIFSHFSIILYDTLFF